MAAKAKKQPKRKLGFFGKTALAGGLAIALSGLGHMAIKSHRLAMEKGNAEIHLAHSWHNSPQAASYYTNLIGQAALRRQPYDFLVMESANMTVARRKTVEERLNQIIGGAARIYRSSLRTNTHQNAENHANEFISKFIKDEFGQLLYTSAAKHGLVVKLAEEHANEQKVAQIEEMSKESIKQLDTMDWDDDTSIWLLKLQKGLLLQQEYTDERDSAITRVTAEAVKELRNSYPEWGKKRLRGLVMLGEGHGAVSEKIQKLRLKKLQVVKERGEIISKDPYIQVRLNIQMKDERLDTIYAVNRVAIAASITPLYQRLFSEGKMDEARNLAKKISDLGPQAAEQIVKSVQNQSGNQRMNTIANYF